MERRFAILALIGVVCAGCAKGNPASPSATPTGTTSFQGTLAGSGGLSGTIDIIVQTKVGVSASRFSFPFVAALHAQSAVTATGTVAFVTGDTFSLAGTYDTTSNRISLTGGGFTLNGGLTNSALIGSFSGPSGTAGGFSTLNATSETITRYCGTISSSQGFATGIWDLNVSSSGRVSGQASSTLGNESINGSLLFENLTFGTGQRSGQAIVSGGVVTGTLTDGSSFVGSTAYCTHVPPPTGSFAKTFYGQFSVQRITNYARTKLNGLESCQATNLISGEAKLELKLDPVAKLVSGQLSATGTDQITSPGCTWLNKGVVEQFSGVPIPLTNTQMNNFGFIATNTTDDFDPENGNFRFLESNTFSATLNPLGFIQDPSRGFSGSETVDGTITLFKSGFSTNAGPFVGPKGTVTSYSFNGTGQAGVTLR